MLSFAIIEKPNEGKMNIFSKNYISILQQSYQRINVNSDDVKEWLCHMHILQLWLNTESWKASFSGYLKDI